MPEYRAIYLDIGADDIDIGQHLGPGSPVGSSRLNIDNDKAGASELRVHNTGTAVGSRPAVNYLAAHASADIEVRNGIVGIGVLVAGETATVGDVVVSSTLPTTTVYVGEGVTLTTFAQAGGTNELAAAGTVTSVTVHGGALDIEGGDYVITTLTVHDGEVSDKHDNAGGTVITTCNVNGGQVDFAEGGFARTVATLNLEGGVVIHDEGFLTVSSSYIGTATGRKRVEVTEA